MGIHSEQYLFLKHWQWIQLEKVWRVSFLFLFLSASAKAFACVCLFFPLLFHSSGLIRPSLFSGFYFIFLFSCFPLLLLISQYSRVSWDHQRKKIPMLVRKYHIISTFVLLNYCHLSLFPHFSKSWDRYMSFCVVSLSMPVTLHWTFPSWPLFWPKRRSSHY